MNKRVVWLVDAQAMTAPEPFWVPNNLSSSHLRQWTKLWEGPITVANYRQAQAKIMRLAAEHTSIRSEWGPTIKIVEQYYSKNGVPIDEDKDWLSNGWFENRFKMRPEPSSGDEIYYVKEGKTTINFHFNREPRFYASLG